MAIDVHPLKIKGSQGLQHQVYQNSPVSRLRPSSNNTWAVVLWSLVQSWALQKVPDFGGEQQKRSCYLEVQNKTVRAVTVS
jgi:hypothetical protein